MRELAQCAVDLLVVVTTIGAARSVAIFLRRSRELAEIESTNRVLQASVDERRELLEELLASDNGE